MIDRNDVIVFQGDSITACGRAGEVTGPNDLAGLGFGYANMAAAQLLADRPADGLRIYNRGMGGNQVSGLAARWQEDCLDLKPNLLSILIGVNDTFAQFDRGDGLFVARFKEVYSRILDEACQAVPGLKLVLCEPFVLVCGRATEEHREEVVLRQQVVRELVEEYDAQFVPLQAVFDQAATEAPPEYWTPDGVHPTAGGHARMALEWLKCVARI